MESNFSTTAIICSWCCYRFFVSETRFTENTSGLYICCAVFLPVQGSLISKRLLTGQKRAFTALLGKSVADTGLVPWHKKSKILFVSSLFLQFRSWFVLFQTLHLNCTQILRKKTLFTNQMKGFFSGDYAQMMVELRRKMYWYLTTGATQCYCWLSLTDLCCAKPHWLLLFFVGIKKCCNGFLLSCHLSSLSSFPPPEIHPFPICPNQ